MKIMLTKDSDLYRMYEILKKLYGSEECNIDFLGDLATLKIPNIVFKFQMQELIDIDLTNEDE